MTRLLPAHPVLLALYPVVFLLAHNIEEFRPGVALAPLCVVGAAALLLFASLSALTGGREKGALLASLAIVLFFGHGFVRAWASAADLDRRPAELSLVLVALAVFAASFVLVWRSRRHFALLNRVLDVAAVVLVLQPLALIAVHEWSFRTGKPPRSAAEPTLDGLRAVAPADAPDVYVLVLDGYGRADVLADVFGADDRELRGYLESVGFYVADDARANYAQTSLALASALNLTYVQDLLQDEPAVLNRKRLRSLRSLSDLIRDNVAFDRLRRRGYSLTAFSSASSRAEMRDPDVHHTGGVLDEFETGVLALTPVPLVARWLSPTRLQGFDPYAHHRERIRYTLEKLPHLTGRSAPRLVFAHILSPHPPFVFGPGGEPTVPAHPFSTREPDNALDYRRGYRAQIQYLNVELRETVAGILANSERTPAIVLMGDHGPASQWVELGFDRADIAEHPGAIRERMSIFLAVLLPSEVGESTALYPGITPINVMRILLDRTLLEENGLIEDKSYFSTYEAPFDFTRVDDMLTTSGRPPQ